MARIPSIQALRALESVARLGTIWQAAEELNLTRSAISHQLRLLERELDFALMLRVGTRIELSPRALDYANDVRSALSLIAAAGQGKQEGELSGTLTISCPGGFAASWLAPRIGGFAALYPAVAISILTPRRTDSTSDPGVDTFISFGHDNRPGIAVEPLQPVEFTPICSPEYLARIGGLPDPAALARATLLHINDYADWEAWLRKVGFPVDWAHRGICFADMNYAYAALIAGQGVAIGDVILWRDLLESGKFVRPFAGNLHSDTGYYLCTPEVKLGNPLVAAFQTWIKTELRNS